MVVLAKHYTVGDRSPSCPAISGNGRGETGVAGQKNAGKWMPSGRGAAVSGGVWCVCPPPDARRIGGPASAPGSSARIFRAPRRRRRREKERERDSAEKDQ